MILIRHGQTHFNVVYGATRQDPGVIDPGLTEEGVRQIEAAAAALAGYELRRILASPYSRALQTAEIVAGQLGLDVEVEPLVRERAYFACDIGSPRSHLSSRWPDFDFRDLAERWWDEPEEPEERLLRRCTEFHSSVSLLDDWRHLLVVSHWGFIKGLTGLAVQNGELVSFDASQA